jgi:hypothetical protein
LAQAAFATSLSNTQIQSSMLANLLMVFLARAKPSSPACESEPGRDGLCLLQLKNEQVDVMSDARSTNSNSLDQTEEFKKILGRKQSCDCRDGVHGVTGEVDSAQCKYEQCQGVEGHAGCYIGRERVDNTGTTAKDWVPKCMPRRCQDVPATLECNKAQLFRDQSRDCSGEPGHCHGDHSYWNFVWQDDGETAAPTPAPTHEWEAPKKCEEWCPMGIPHGYTWPELCIWVHCEGCPECEM